MVLPLFGNRDTRGQLEPLVSLSVLRPDLPWRPSLVNQVGRVTYLLQRLWVPTSPYSVVSLVLRLDRGLDLRD